MNKFRLLKILGKKGKNIFTLLILSGAIIGSNPHLAHASKINPFNVEVLQQIKDAKITLNLNNKSLRDILTQIQKKSGVGFALKDEIEADILKKMSINVTNTSVENTLQILLKDTGYDFTIIGNSITIIKAAQIPQPTKTSPTKTLVKGKIIDADTKKPIPGATVIVRGTATGAISDEKGAFSIPVVVGQILDVTYVGMKRVELKLTDLKKELIIAMDNDAIAVKDVVVTGYQVIDKRMSSSSVVSINAEDLLESVGSTLDKMFQGKIAGMSVMGQSSTIGAAPKIRIRGSSSIMGNREPVWVIDGIVMDDPVPLSPTQLNNPDRINLVGNAISGLNPQDIERIDILKDASATAIYGVKAANGVIVVTTKRGKKGDPSIRYSTSLSILERPSWDKMYMMNSKDRIEVSEEIHLRGLEQRGGFTPKGLGYEGALQELWDGNITDEQFHVRVKNLKETNMDWYKELFQNSFSQSHTLSVSGATDNVSYYVSAGYTSEKGTPKTEKGDRLNFMSNVDIKVSKRLSARLGLSASNGTNERPHESIDLNKYAYYTSPAIPARNSDEELNFYGAKNGYGPRTLTYNILNELDQSGQSSRSSGFNANLNLNYKLATWLNWNAIVSYASNSSHQESYYTERSYSAAEQRGVDYGEKLPSSDDFIKNACKLPFGGVLNTDDYTNSTYNGRTSLGFNKVFAEKHSLSFDAGMEIRSSGYIGTRSEIYGYLHDRGKQVAEVDYTTWVQYGKDQSRRVPTYTDTRTNTMSYYGTVSYGYDYRYIINANVRGDASNKLGMDKSTRFLPIWSVSGRWNIDREAFLNSSALWISRLAIRGSFGLQGNITDEHNPNMRIKYGTIDSKSQEYIAILAALPNKGLLWEKTSSFNFGLEYGFLNNRIRGEFEYYTKVGKDQLLTTEIAPSNGGKLVTINAGDIHNEGWELTLQANVIKTKNFNWDIGFNTSKNYNKIKNQGDIPYTYSDYTSGRIIKNDRAVNSFYSYQFGGLDNTGWPIFKGTEEKDENGNQWASRDVAFARAFIYSGKREADLTGGINTSVSYKWVSLSALFSVSLGAKTRLNNLFESYNFKLPYPHQNMQNEFVNRWKKAGDEKFTDIPALTDRVATSRPNGPMGDAYRSTWDMYNNGDMRVVSANFLRCRSISMSISIPSEITNKIYCKGASLSLGVSNPFVIKSKSLNGRDPEQIELGNGVLPPLRTYSVSLSLSF